MTAIPAPPTTTEVPTNSSSIAPIAEGKGAEKAIAATSVPSLTAVLERLPSGQGFLGSGLQTGQGGEGGGMPPLPPGLGKKWVPVPGGDIPRDEHAYFPMIGYK